jgi:hypothetical protein
MFMSMSDAKLIKVVSGFRRGILGKKKPDMMCFAVSSPLSTYLKICGVENKMKEVCVVQGSDVYYHWYLELKDGRILDATASQFVSPKGERMPPVFLGERPYWYQLTKTELKKSHKPTTNVNQQ